jgi:hypothetical protein
MGGAYSMHGRDEKFKPNLSENQKTCHICVIERPRHDWRIILKSILDGVLM